MEHNTCEHVRWVVHGRRRKRCSGCKKTKTIRPQKRGRKQKRVNIGVLRKYLSGKSVRTSIRDVRRARDLLVRTTPWPDLSHLKGHCILIADALHIRTRTYRAFVHIILIASLDDDRAWILPMHVDTRGENRETWQTALEHALTPALHARIKALVCDGKASLLSLAREEGWVVQRCQFHLIARLQLKRSKYALSRHRQEGIMLYELAKTVFTTTSDEDCIRAVRALMTVARTESNKYLRTIVSGFTKHYRDYRAHLEYPELHLPHTTNAVESLNSIVRGLLQRMHGVRTRKAAEKWIEALLKQRQFIRLKRHTFS